MGWNGLRTVTFGGAIADVRCHIEILAFRFRATSSFTESVSVSALYQGTVFK